MINMTDVIDWYFVTKIVLNLLEKLLKFEAEGQKFAKFFRLLEQLKFKLGKNIGIEKHAGKVRKVFFTKICSDFLLFEQIVLVISKFLQIYRIQPRISKVFLNH